MARSKSNLSPGQYYCTLEQVSQEIGLSREGVRKVEQRALEKVRKALEAKGITRTCLDDYTDRDYYGPQKNTDT